MARELRLPESTVRYYRDRYAPWVPAVGEGRGRRYPVEALEVLRVIADLSRAGTPAAAIEDALRARFPLNVEAQPQQQQLAATQQQDAAAMRALLADVVREAVEDATGTLMAEVIALREDVQRLRADLEQAQQQQTAAAEPQPPAPAAESATTAAEPPRPWWDRWLRGAR